MRTLPRTAYPETHSAHERAIILPSKACPVSLNERLVRYGRNLNTTLNAVASSTALRMPHLHLTHPEFHFTRPSRMPPIRQTSVHGRIFFGFVPLRLSSSLANSSACLRRHHHMRDVVISWNETNSLSCRGLSSIQRTTCAMHAEAPREDLLSVPFRFIQALRTVMWVRIIASKKLQ